MCHFVIPQLDVFEAAELYQKEGIPVIILAGKKYGLGSSRDWAAKGPLLLVLLVCLGLGVVLLFLEIPKNALCNFFVKNLHGREPLVRIDLNFLIMYFTVLDARL